MRQSTLMVRGVAHALELVLLQHAQQFHLQLVADGVDFVEQDRAAVGSLKSPRAVFDGAGEGSLHVAEQFAFEQAFAQRAAVDADKRASGARTKLVQGAGDQFLAGPRFPGEQYGCRRPRDATRELQHFPNGDARPDDAFDGSRFTGIG